MNCGTNKLRLLTVFVVLFMQHGGRSDTQTAVS